MPACLPVAEIFMVSSVAQSAVGATPKCAPDK